MKRKSAGFISLFLICSAVLHAGIMDYSITKDSLTSDETVIYDNKAVADAFKIGVPTAVLAGVLALASNEEFRWYFADRWTRFTSPNHAAPDQYREFYFKPWSEEIAQETQCDKGVHYIFSYLPVMPAATILDRSYYILSAGKYRNRLSDWSVLSASAIVVGFGLMEEYMDGHQIGEGFDLFDLAANVAGVATSLLEHYGILKDVYFYWSFNRDMFRESGYGEKWPWWIYMAGYEFYVQIDVLSIMQRREWNNQLFSSVVKTVGYLPDFKSFWKLKYNNNMEVR